MVEAVTSGATQGIGLCRPITAEPDLPKKILERSVPSAIHDVLDQDDFAVTLLASNTQIEQMGRSSLEEANGDVTYAISDFSDEATVQRYAMAIGEFVEKLKREAAEGKSTPSVIRFE